MSEAILKKLPKLQEDSGKRLTGVIEDIIRVSENPKPLTKAELVANGVWRTKIAAGTESLRTPENRVSVQKVRVLKPSEETSRIRRLNRALQGGKDYPILSSVTGALAGIVSSGAGFLFSAGSTGLSLSKTSPKVLARAGDEIYHVQEIGRGPGKDSDKVFSVSSFFLVDPYRKKSTGHNGWLIHEDRDEVTL